METHVDASSVAFSISVGSSASLARFFDALGFAVMTGVGTAVSAGLFRVERRGSVVSAIFLAVTKSQVYREQSHVKHFKLVGFGGDGG